MVIMKSGKRNRVSCMALALQMFIMLKGVESQVSTSSSSVSYASVTGHASSASQLPSVSAAVTTSSKPLLSSTLTTTAATTEITPTPSVTLSSSSAESQVTTSYASVTGHASSAPQLPSVSAAVTTSNKPLLSSTLTATTATTGITSPPSVTLSSSSTESQVTTSYASVTGHESSAPQLSLVSVTVTTSTKLLLSSTLTTTLASPRITSSPSVTLLSSSAESQAAVTTSTKPSSMFSLSLSKTPLLSSTLTTTLATTGITLSTSVALLSSSIPQTPELTKSSPGISPSSVSSDVKPTDPTTSVSETTPSPSPTSAFLSSPNVSSTPLHPKPQKPSIYIKMFFSMSWRRFCYLTSLFKESLSRKLLGIDRFTWHYMPLERIRLYNAKEKCANKTLYYNKDAILELFIARMGEENNADKKKTIEAFELLYGYWTNKRMILLDPVFEGKVTKVALVGVDEDKYIPEYTEAQRIGIAIGVALAILVVILIVIYFVKRYMTSHQARPKPADGKMVITNEHAFEETTVSDLTNAASKPLETQEEMSEVPEQVVVHKQPSPTQTEKSQVDVKVEDKTPLLSMIKDYEDGKSGGETAKSDQEASETETALEAKPEPEDFDGRPIKPPRSDSMIDAEIVLPESISQISKVVDTEQQVKNEEEGIEPVQTVEERTEPGKNQEEGTEPGKTEEEGKEERRPSFTSSVTVNIRPEAATTSKEFDYPAKEQPPDTQTDNNNQAPTGDDEISEDEKVKPDFGQSDSGDTDPNEGAINLGFDDDEAQKEEKKKEEETKF